MGIINFLFNELKIYLIIIKYNSEYILIIPQITYNILQSFYFQFLQSKSKMEFYVQIYI